MARLIDLDKIKPMDFPSYEMDGLDVVRYLNTLPTVDAVEVSRLGKLGRLMMPYTGCPRGMFGTRGVSGVDDHKMVIVTELDPIIDVDGNRWVPVLDSDLASLKANVQNSVEVVRCKDCKYFNVWGDGNKTCDYWKDQWDCATDEDAFCYYGERKSQ